MCSYSFIIFRHNVYDQAAFIKVMIMKKRDILSGCKAEDSQQFLNVKHVGNVLSKKI